MASSQRGLFDRPASHARDPQTSRDAERVHTDFGARGAHCRAVLAAVAANPMLTASELADLVPYDLYETRRRLTDLLNAGLVKQAGTRKAPGRNRRESCWRKA